MEENKEVYFYTTGARLESLIHFLLSYVAIYIQMYFYLFIKRRKVINIKFNFNPLQLFVMKSAAKSWRRLLLVVEITSWAVIGC